MGSTDSNIKDALKAQDIRSTPLFHNVQQHYKNIIDPAIGKISNATDLQLSPHGTHVVFTAHVWESIEKSQATRIAEVHLDSGDVRFLSTSSSSHGDAQKPRYSPDGRTVAYTAVNPDTGEFRSAQELRALYEDQLGLSPEKETIAYCRIGERSSHTWFALTYLLGFANVRNYDGSWTEWGNSVRLPIER